eukprot:2372056-Lingulodinium_polyedra.AAC.1
MPCSELLHCGSLRRPQGPIERKGWGSALGATGNTAKPAHGIRATLGGQSWRTTRRRTPLPRC